MPATSEHYHERNKWIGSNFRKLVKPIDTSQPRGQRRSEATRRLNVSPAASTREELRSLDSKERSTCKSRGDNVSEVGNARTGFWSSSLRIALYILCFRIWVQLVLSSGAYLT
ncbi:hypothetical protein R1flu_014559 [Riccia fluitans]|uniref:Uncharacterized protein n=1 Tax=Riccia fluitans TaxID=41844 RepID=A0ABD1YGU3_9MARC